MNPNAGEQQSVEWLYQRCGNITASRFKDVVKKNKNGKYSEKRETYLLEVVVERLTGKPTTHYTTVAMMWGQEQEDASRMAYEARTHAIIEQVGYTPHPTLMRVGGSVDGLIDEDGVWESKSPFNSANHIYTLLDGMPEEHIAQVQGYLWITGRKWCDFTSYDPRLPAPLDLYVQRIPRDEEYIEAMETEICQFENEAQSMIAKLHDRYKAIAAAAQTNGGI